MSDGVQDGEGLVPPGSMTGPPPLGPPWRVLLEGEPEEQVITTTVRVMQGIAACGHVSTWAVDDLCRFRTDLGAYVARRVLHDESFRFDMDAGRRALTEAAAPPPGGRLSEEVLRRWVGCDREEAIRQAEQKHGQLQAAFRVQEDLREQVAALRKTLAEVRGDVGRARALLAQHDAHEGVATPRPGTSS